MAPQNSHGGPTPGGLISCPPLSTPFFTYPTPLPFHHQCLLGCPILPMLLIAIHQHRIRLPTFSSMRTDCQPPFENLPRPPQHYPCKHSYETRFPLATFCSLILFTLQSFLTMPRFSRVRYHPPHFNANSPLSTILAYTFSTTSGRLCPFQPFRG